jgi:hypothetical protein
MRRPQRCPSKILALASGILLLSLVGCVPDDDLVDELRAQLQQRDQQIAQLEKEKTAFNLQVTELTAENRRLAVALKDGMQQDEMRNRLTEWEARLQNWQADADEREEAQNQRDEDLERRWKEFYDDTNLTREQIGEAKQALATHDELVAERDTAKLERTAAENRANNWLKGLAGLGAGLVAALFVVIVLFMKYRVRGKEVDALLLFAESVPEEQRTLLGTASVTKLLTDRRGRRD